MLEIKYAKEAIEDLKMVYLGVFEASRDIETTEKYFAGLKERIKEQCKRPKTGTRLYYKNTFSGIYFVTYKAYIAFYKVSDEFLYVIKIALAKSDYLKEIFGDK
ncbi:MAG: hypothetical protein K6B15_04755 [Parasporobacterium sp.]|nr:hypothetical protein [Parasporobacterium sp.]